MGRINVLDKHLAELIAAGEVVERPSSAIKELVENSIDSGATAVTVEVQQGGKTMIRITDNGSGILREDIRNAFKRHATSKVSSQSDLDAIGTLGFRGEALASISAVAKVELLTKAREEEVGTHYVIEGGEEKLLEDAGCPDGTTFIVRDLFFNTPARAKYLKTDSGETTAAANVVDKIALSHSDVAFTFIRDNRRTLKTAGDGNEKNCIYSVLGRDFSKNCAPVDYELGSVKVKGFVTKPQAARPTRAMQNFFINGRFVKTRTAMAALEEACKGMVMVGKYPGCVLHLEMPLDRVDVNVHPAKIEVRFAEERPVFEAVYHAVRSALISGDTVKQFKLETPKAADLVDRSSLQSPFTLSPAQVNRANAPKQFSREPDRRSLEIYKSVIEDAARKREESAPRTAVRLNDSAPAALSQAYGANAAQAEPRETSYSSIDIIADEETALGIPKKQDAHEPEPELIEREKADAPEHVTAAEHTADTRAQDIPEKPPVSADELERTSEDDNGEIQPLTDIGGDKVRFIGEAFCTYIIIERNNELVMIDKHALHERIIYERLRREQGRKYAQYLLQPVAVSLSKPQCSAILDNLELMSESGFEVDDFGAGTVLVRSAPSFIDAFDVAATVEEMAEHILDNKTNIESEYTDWLYHNIACRSAIKGGDKSSPQELIDLYLKMGEDPNYRYCPHGRPTSIVLTKYQIEKQFGRLG